MILTGREYAFIGDAVWALVIKEKLLKQHVNLGKDINVATQHYLSALAQSQLFLHLENQHFFNDEELAIYKKGRNIKVNKPKSHENITTYRIASGFEAIIGYHYLNRNVARIEEIVEICLREN